MKNWTVTFRNKNGCQESIIVEAVDRADVFAESKKRGITSIIRISECEAIRGGAFQKIKARHIRVVVALFVILAGIAVLFHFVGDRSVDSQPSVKIKVKSPQPKPTIEKQPPSESPKKKPLKTTDKRGGRNAGAKTYVDERGVTRYEGGARVFDKSKIRKKPLRVTEKPIFKHYAENQIYALIDIVPGETIFVTRRYDNRFLESFKKSLEEPIELLESDTARERELKLAMIETKEDLKKRMADGEDICKIMEDTYSEIQRLAEYKKEIKQMVDKALKKGDLTDADCDDLIRAANMMLEEKGMSPIKNTMLIKHNIILKANKKGINQ